MARSEVAKRELAKCRAIRGELCARNVSADAWRAMDGAMRRLLVTLADVQGDKADVRDWREFSEHERVSLGASARYISGQLSRAASLLW